MRVGGPTFVEADSPASWVAAVHAAGYRAAYCPVTPEADAETINAYAEAARKAFAVHLDPANLVCSPQRYFANAYLIERLPVRAGDTPDAA